jgi:HAD superfamily phosphoserine phosphatase-like hydrolase
MSDSQRALFVRVEGILTDRGARSAAAYFAANAAGMRERALRLGHLALTAPIYQVLGQSDRVLANRLTYVALRGMSEDRIAELADEYWQNVLRSHVLASGRELLRRARSEQQRIVLLSDGIESVIAPLIEYLACVDDYVCNRLEFRGGNATGRLLDPVVGGHDGGQFLRGYARERGIDLELCTAYGAHGPDLLLLTAVGRPCAVNPDFTLRRAAREAGWPVMDYHV